MPVASEIYDALRAFADAVTAKFAGAAAGEPEEQLRAWLRQSPEGKAAEAAVGALLKRCLHLVSVPPRGRPMRPSVPESTAWPYVRPG